MATNVDEQSSAPLGSSITRCIQTDTDSEDLSSDSGEGGVEEDESTDDETSIDESSKDDSETDSSEGTDDSHKDEDTDSDSSDDSEESNRPIIYTNNEKEIQGKKQEKNTHDVESQTLLNNIEHQTSLEGRNDVNSQTTHTEFHIDMESQTSLKENVDAHSQTSPTIHIDIESQTIPKRRTDADSQTSPTIHIDIESQTSPKGRTDADSQTSQTVHINMGSQTSQAERNDINGHINVECRMFPKERIDTGRESDRLNTANHESAIAPTNSNSTRPPSPTRRVGTQTKPLYKQCDQDQQTDREQETIDTQTSFESLSRYEQTPSRLDQISGRSSPQTTPRSDQCEDYVNQDQNSPSLVHSEQVQHSDQVQHSNQVQHSEQPPIRKQKPLSKRQQRELQLYENFIIENRGGRKKTKPRPESSVPGKTKKKDKESEKRKTRAASAPLEDSIACKTRLQTTNNSGRGVCLAAYRLLLQAA